MRIDQFKYKLCRTSLLIDNETFMLKEGQSRNIDVAMGNYNAMQTCKLDMILYIAI